MSAVAAYFGNIKEAIVTTIVGLKITSRHLWTQPPSTVQYPEVPVEKLLPERYRGFLVNEVEICTGCKLCANVCPIDVIYIDVEKDEESGVRTLTSYDIEFGRCMYWGIGLEPCPTGSIHFTPQFEGATYELGDLYRKFVAVPAPIYKNPRPPKPPVAKEEE